MLTSFCRPQPKSNLLAQVLGEVESWRQLQLHALCFFPASGPVSFATRRGPPTSSHQPWPKSSSRIRSWERPGAGVNYSSGLLASSQLPGPAVWQQERDPLLALVSRARWHDQQKFKNHCWPSVYTFSNVFFNSKEVLQKKTCSFEYSFLCKIPLLQFEKNQKFRSTVLLSTKRSMLAYQIV